MPGKKPGSMEVRSFMAYHSVSGQELSVSVFISFHDKMKQEKIMGKALMDHKAHVWETAVESQYEVDWMQQIWTWL